MNIVRTTHVGRVVFIVFLSISLLSANYVHAATITWSAQTAAEDNTWQSIVYGEGIFVAVSSNGTNRVMTSPDGVTWTARSAPDGTTDSTWKSIAYGNGTFVAVANGGTTKVMTSPDGETWTAQTPAEDNSWESVTFGNGTFVAVADTGTNRAMSSTDGVTWSPHLVSATTWKAVTYGNGTFVAVNDRDRAMTSADGATWNLHTMDGNYAWRSLTYGNGVFVAVAGNMAIDTSPNGSSWTSRSFPSGFSAGLVGVTYGGDTFVAVPSNTVGKVIVSSDGITWSIQDTVSGSGWLGITYGNNRFVAVGGSTARVITGATVPTVTTQDASSVSATSVTGNGTITSEGTASSTARGFVYGADTSYGATTTESGTFGAGGFTASITSLTCGTTYHYAAYATNTFGTSYGSDTTFTTSACTSSPSSSANTSDGSLPWCSGPMAPGWNISLPGGGCSSLNIKEAQQMFPRTCSSYPFMRTLRLGVIGEDVRALQKLMNCLGFTLADTGPGSEGKETNVFSERTLSAVKKFQETYSLEILNPINATKGTGIFAELSRKKAQTLTFK